jgi:hypothetical protein
MAGDLMLAVCDTGSIGERRGLALDLGAPPCLTGSGYREQNGPFPQGERAISVVAATRFDCCAMTKSLCAVDIRFTQTHPQTIAAVKDEVLRNGQTWPSHIYQQLTRYLI